MDWNNILSYAVKKVDQSIKLKYFPHITENGKWVMLGKKNIMFLYVGLLFYRSNAENTQRGGL